MASIKSYARVYAGGKTGKVWKVAWREGGKQRSKTLYSLRSAKSFKGQVEARLAEGKGVDPFKGRIKYQDFIQQHGSEWQADLTDKVKRNYDYMLRTLLLPFFGQVPLNRIGRESVADWVASVRSDWSAWTLFEAFATLRSSLGYAVRRKTLDSNPVSGCGDLLPKRPKRRKKVLLSPGDVMRLADAVDARHRALVLLMGVHGLRPGEALALTVGDVHLTEEQPYISVTKAVTESAGRMILNQETKTGEDRDVELFSFVADALYEHLATHVVDNLEDDALLFPQPRAKGYMHESYLRGGFAYVWKPGPAGRKVRTSERRPTGIIVPAAHTIGKPGVTPYTLRHIACVNVIEQTQDIEYARRMLGHTNVEMTLRFYNHATEGAAKRVRATMEGVFAAELEIAVDADDPHVQQTEPR